MGFPTSPTDGQVYTAASGVKYQYVSATTKWRIMSEAIAIINDLTPQLGGDLDTNDHNITLTTDKILYFRNSNSFINSHADTFLQLYASYKIILDADYVECTNDLNILTDKKIYFRDTNTNIYSTSSGELKEVTSVQHWISSAGSVYIDGTYGRLRGGTTEILYWDSNNAIFYKDAYMNTDKILYFRDAYQHISSPWENTLFLNANTYLYLQAPVVTSDIYNNSSSWIQTSVSSTNTDQCYHYFNRYDYSSPNLLPVQNGFYLGKLSFGGYDGTSIITGAYINAICTGSVSTGVVPTTLQLGSTQDIYLYTPTTYIKNAGWVTVYQIGSSATDYIRPVFQQQRYGNSYGTVVNGDWLGTYSICGYDGSGIVQSAYIEAKVNGSVSTGVVPALLTIYSTNTIYLQASNIQSYATAGDNYVDARDYVYIRCVDSDTSRTVAQFDTVEDGDSYIKITNGKASTSSVILETDGSANSLEIKAKGDNFLYFYTNSVLRSEISSLGIRHYVNQKMANNTYLQWLNNAGDNWLNMIYTNTSDALVLGTNAAYVQVLSGTLQLYNSILKLTNNYGVQWLNQAGNAWKECLLYDTSNIFRVGETAGLTQVRGTNLYLGDANETQIYLTNSSSSWALCFKLDSSNILQIGTEVTSINLAKATTTPEVIVSNPQQYKHANCLQWGTSGTPVNITVWDSTSNIKTIGNHVSACEFTANNDGSNASIPLRGSTISISMWVQSDHVDQNVYFLNLYDEGPTHKLAAFTISSGGLYYITPDEASAVEFMKITINTWYHLRIDYSKSSVGNYIRWYCNDELVYSQTAGHDTDAGIVYLFWKNGAHSGMTVSLDAVCWNVSNKYTRMNYKTGPINAESIFSDYTNTDEIHAKTAKIGDTNNYKGTQCLQGGVSDYTANNATLTLETKGGHLDTIKQEYTGSNCRQIYTPSTAMSGGSISKWYYTDSTHSEMYPIIFVNSGTDRWYLHYNNGLLRLYDGTGWNTITSNAKGKWIHIGIQWTKGSKALVYLNGTLAVVSANNTPNLDIDRIDQYIGTSGDISWSDAMYLSTTNKRQAFLSLSDKQVDDNTLTDYGYKGWHYRQYVDEGVWNAQYSCATNDRSVILDFLNGHSASVGSGITETTAPSIIVPPIVKTLLVQVEILVDSANSANYCIVSNADFGITAQGLRAWGAGTNNFPLTYSLPISTNVDGHIKLWFGRGAGTVTCYMKILGYEL